MSPKISKELAKHRLEQAIVKVDMILLKKLLVICNSIKYNSVQFDTVKKYKVFF